MCSRVAHLTRHVTLSVPRNVHPPHMHARIQCTTRSRGQGRYARDARAARGRGRRCAKRRAIVPLVSICRARGEAPWSNALPSTGSGVPCGQDGRRSVGNREYITRRTRASDPSHARIHTQVGARVLFEHAVALRAACWLAFPRTNLLPLPWAPAKHCAHCRARATSLDLRVVVRACACDELPDETR